MSEDNATIQQRYANACDEARTIARNDELGRQILVDQLRPFIRLKTKISRDGNQWCVLYGDDLENGVAGFGDTPEQASVDFDHNWLNEQVGKTIEDDLSQYGFDDALPLRDRADNVRRSLPRSMAIFSPYWSKRISSREKHAIVLAVSIIEELLGVEEEI